MGKTKRRPDLFLVLTWVASVAAVVTLLWILESIVTPAWPAIQQTGLNFFTSTVWDVNRDRYGAMPFLIGTTDEFAHRPFICACLWGCSSRCS